MLDWSLGEYERTADELEPAARHVVELAALAPGERVLDIACGTGNAALLAARAGAVVSGLDAAPRLIDVARARATAAGVDASFVVGDAEALPFDDGAYDAVLSIFGVIFAADAQRAIAEILRVLAPAGRVLLAVWVPAGPIHEMVGVLARGVLAAGGPRLPRFAWEDSETLGAVAARHGARVEALDARLVIEHESPEAYFSDAEQHHPMSIGMRPLLERAGTYPQLRAEAIDALRAGNEDPGAFRITSPYRVMRLARGG